MDELHKKQVALRRDVDPCRGGPGRFPAENETFAPCFLQIVLPAIRRGRNDMQGGASLV